MARYLVKLRYYPGDSLEEIKEGDLKNFEKEFGVRIDYEKIEKRELKKGLLMEETGTKSLEEISQEIITISSDTEDFLSNCIIALYRKYRSPRTVYSFLGSNEAGQRIAKKLMNTFGGW